MAADTSPGVGVPQFNKFWLGEGLSRWAESPTPYRTLRSLLLQHMSIEKASGLAAEYFHEHFGFWPGSAEHRRMGGK